MSDTIKNTARNTDPTIKPVTFVDEATKPVTVVEEEKPVTVVEEATKPVTVIEEEKPVTVVEEATRPKTIIEEEKPVTVVEEATRPKTIIEEEKPVTIVEDSFPPVIGDEGDKPVTVVDEIVAPSVIEESKGTSEEITLTIDKSTLVSLCQNLNTNLLVNIAAYKSVLAKLKDSEKDETKVSELDSNITNLNEIESSVSNLLNTVQTSLDVPKDKQIDPQTVIQKASSSGSGDFMQKVMGAEAAAVLGSMAAATVLALGGAKRKITKRRRNKGRKSTKRHKK